MDISILETAADAYDDANANLLAAVQQARREGASWSTIGDAIGVSKQAAQQKYGPLCSPLGTIDRVTTAGKYVDARTTRHAGQPSGS